MLTKVTQIPTVCSCGRKANMNLLATRKTGPGHWAGDSPVLRALQYRLQPQSEASLQQEILPLLSLCLGWPAMPHLSSACEHAGFAVSESELGSLKSLAGRMTSGIRRNSLGLQSPRSCLAKAAPREAEVHSAPEIYGHVPGCYVE